MQANHDTIPTTRTGVTELVLRGARWVERHGSAAALGYAQELSDSLANVVALLDEGSRRAEQLKCSLSPLCSRAPSPPRPRP